jgi:hypothetical protein
MRKEKVTNMTKGTDVSRETPTLLGPLERSNINHWATHVSIITADTEKSFGAFVLRCRSADTERNFGAFVLLCHSVHYSLKHLGHFVSAKPYPGKELRPSELPYSTG